MSLTDEFDAATAAAQEKQAVLQQPRHAFFNQLKKTAAGLTQVANQVAVSITEAEAIFTQNSGQNFWTPEEEAEARELLRAVAEMDKSFGASQVRLDALLPASE